MISTFMAQLLGLGVLGGLAVGLIVPRLGAALGISAFVGAFASFALASTSGQPVPMAGWMLAFLAALLAATLGWWIRGRRRG